MPPNKQRQFALPQKQLVPLPEPPVKTCPECLGDGKHRQCKGEGCWDCRYTKICDVCNGDGVVLDYGRR